MKELPRFPDDPRLTAYALGELEGDERAAIEAALRRDPALRIALEEIRALTGQVEEALDDEPMLPAAGGRRVNLEPAAVFRSPAPDRMRVDLGPLPTGPGTQPSPVPPGKLLAFPKFHYAVGGFAAACLAVFIALQPAPRPTTPHAAKPNVQPRESTAGVALTVTLPVAEASISPIGSDSAIHGPARLDPVATTADVGAVAADAPLTSHLVRPQETGEGPAGLVNLFAQPVPLETPAPDFTFTVPAVGSFALNGSGPLLGPGTGLRATVAPVIPPLSDPQSRSAGQVSQAFVRPRQDGKIPLPGIKVNAKANESRGAAGRVGARAESSSTAMPPGGGVPVDARRLTDALTPEILERARTNLAPAGGTDLFSGPRRAAPGGRVESGTRAPFRRDHDFVSVAHTTLSFPPLAIETTSYPEILRFVRTRQLPPADAVRIEEMLNFFPVRVPKPGAGNGAGGAPLDVAWEVAEAPWAPKHRLVRIALKGREFEDGVPVPTASTGPGSPIRAKDVRLQVEFNPENISHHRLIGYENRAPVPGQFSGEWLDTGELTAAQSLTLLYEVVPAGTEGESGPGVVVRIDELKYSTPRIGRVAAEIADELMTLTVRYQEPAGGERKKIELPLVDSGARFGAASADFKFAAAVAGFGMILRNSPHKGTATMADVIAWASGGVGTEGEDADGLRSEFVALARQTQGLLRGE